MSFNRVWCTRNDEETLSDCKKQACHTSILSRLRIHGYSGWSTHPLAHWSRRTPQLAHWSRSDTPLCAPQVIYSVCTFVDCHNLQGFAKSQIQRGTSFCHRLYSPVGLYDSITSRTKQSQKHLGTRQTSQKLLPCTHHRLTVLKLSQDGRMTSISAITAYDCL